MENGNKTGETQTHRQIERDLIEPGWKKWKQFTKINKLFSGKIRKIQIRSKDQKSMGERTSFHFSGGQSKDFGRWRNRQSWPTAGLYRLCLCPFLLILLFYLHHRLFFLLHTYLTCVAILTFGAFCGLFFLSPLLQLRSSGQTASSSSLSRLRFVLAAAAAAAAAKMWSKS